MTPNAAMFSRVVLQLVVVVVVVVVCVEGASDAVKLTVSPASACVHERVRVHASARAAACGFRGASAGCSVDVTAKLVAAGGHGSLLLGTIDLPLVDDATGHETRLRPVVGCALDDGLCGVALASIDAVGVDDGGRGGGGGGVVIRFTEPTMMPDATSSDALNAFLWFDGPWPAIRSGKQRGAARVIMIIVIIARGLARRVLGCRGHVVNDQSRGAGGSWVRWACATRRRRRLVSRLPRRLRVDLRRVAVSAPAADMEAPLASFAADGAAVRYREFMFTPSVEAVVEICATVVVRGMRAVVVVVVVVSL